MPIYPYLCTNCGHQFDALQRMSDAKLVDCPACNKPTLKKQLTAAAFKLNGTGWYETDFKNSGKPPAKPSADKEPSAGNKEPSAGNKEPSAGNTSPDASNASKESSSDSSSSTVKTDTKSNSTAAQTG